MTIKSSIWKLENTAHIAKISIESTVVIMSLAASIATMLIATNVIAGPAFLASTASPIGITALFVITTYFAIKAISSYHEIHAIEKIQAKANNNNDTAFAALIGNTVKSGEIVEKKIQGADGKGIQQLFLVLPINDYKALVGNDKKAVHVLLADKKVEVELAHIDPKDDASEYRAKVIKVSGKDQFTDMKTELGMSNSSSLKVAVSNQDLKALKANISAKLVDVAVESAIEKARKVT
ncbi:hypothetical protein GOY13_02730 [Wolbachia endosymbiont of Cruorifilaria tuberocauda]|uniref:hypothetical protein n=1 Tax=Wolbachia endosymbiont of Cruorifilaria tuberocauda TaxID=1812111 RepID=UPI00158DDA4D|nr:hypothetical protein [Wolbachia endosymbiont of Cruorifilaria tuberocauda]QKX01826.1 hypothetical protein GOY13_02730 [Wolbachia endosymbiont of Cruorifilaria tuberocauda]